MANVFISYHEKSAGELAGQIADKLDAVGISSWCARRNLPPGGNFALNIPTQIHNCRLFLLILTESAYQSKHVLNEVGIAFSRYNKGENITILPIEIGDFTRKDWVEYYLIHTQSVKIPQPDAQRVETLIAQIARILSAPPRMAQTTPPLKPTPQATAPLKSAITDSGRTGDCKWTLDRDGVLTISGKGRMTDYCEVHYLPSNKWKMNDFPFSYPWPRSRIRFVVIQYGVTSIGSGAFYGFSVPQSATIPNSVTSIGEYAFCKCSSLTSVTIPDSVTSIGRSAFGGCRSLTNVTIPDGVTSIEDRTFESCKNLTSVTIPDSVTSIGRAAFRDCSSLTSVIIPDSVISIGSGAFNDCANLKSVTVSSRAQIGYGGAFDKHTQVKKKGWLERLRGKPN